MNRTQPSETKLVILCMAPVYGVAPKAGDGGGDSKAVAGDAGLAFAELRRATKGIAGHGYFCGLLAASGTIEGRQKIEVDPFDGDWRGAIDVPGAAGLRNPRDESKRNIFGAHGGAHDGLAAGACAEFSGTRCGKQDHAHWSQQELWTSRST